MSVTFFCVPQFLLTSDHEAFVELADFFFIMRTRSQPISPSGLVSLETIPKKPNSKKRSNPKTESNKVVKRGSKRTTKKRKESLSGAAETVLSASNGTSHTSKPVSADHTQRRLSGNSKGEFPNFLNHQTPVESMNTPKGISTLNDPLASLCHQTSPMPAQSNALKSSITGMLYPFPFCHHTIIYALSLCPVPVQAGMLLDLLLNSMTLLYLRKIMLYIHHMFGPIFQLLDILPCFLLEFLIHAAVIIPPIVFQNRHRPVSQKKTSCLVFGFLKNKRRVMTILDFPA